MNCSASSLAFCIALAVGCASPRPAVAATPTFDEVRAAYRSSETTFTDRHGETVQVLRTDPSVRKLAWTSLADVSPALRSALVYSEDRRFYEHAGVDWRAVGAAAWGNLWNIRTRGASTITMQLAGLLDGDLERTSGGRSIGQKLSQAATAIGIERAWKKDQILEAYLNLVGYRGELVGVAALSATLFEKYPSGLDAREAAITAALVRAPNAPPARVAERACAILQAETLPDECRGLADYTTLVLARKNAPRLDSDPQLAPQFARAVLRSRVKSLYKDDPVVATTLDARLQRFARATLRSHLAELAQRNVEDGAVVVIDNASGDVLAWVGSSGDLSSAAEVDHVLAPRQAGSTLKPFLYELAIEQRWLTAASILDDTPVALATANGLYIPQNYDHDFKGPVSVRKALASSLNVPAVRTLVMVTPERFHQRLLALGFTTLRESGDYYGYSLALGSAEVTLAELTNAYRALAERGRVGALSMIVKRSGEVEAGGMNAGTINAANRDAGPINAASMRVASTAAARTNTGSTSTASTNTASTNTGSTNTGGTNTGGTNTGSTNRGSTNRGSTSAGRTNAGRTNAGRTNAGSTSTGRASAGSSEAGVMDAGASLVVADILADRNARATTFGMDSVLATRVWSAVKTGTSKDMRDNWCVGFTERYTVGVWVGNSGGEAMWDVSGTTGAAPVWQAIVNELASRERREGPLVASAAAGEAGRAVSRDPGLVKRSIRFDGDLEAPRDELFLAGTEASLIAFGRPAAATGSGSAGGASGLIAQPVDGTVLAIDPDIPPQKQVLRFAVSRAVAGRTYWRLDRRIVGSGPVFDWALWPGRHVLELVDVHGAAVDRVAFSVRGVELRKGTAAPS
jgi:penicillin-binding protein 1C